MKRPRLSDYNLDEKAVTLYRNQLEKYSQLRRNIEEKNAAYNKKLTIISVLLVAVTLVVFFGIIESSEAPMDVVWSMWVFHALTLIILSCVEKKEETSFGVILLLSVLGTLCLPFISLGMCVYFSFERNDKYICKEYPKQKYVDISVEKQFDAYTNAMQEYNKWREKRSKDYWIQMDGYEFEDAIAKLYESQGYIAEQTSYSGDGGVDIVLFKEGRKIAVQCKHHSKPIGPNDVRALMGVVASQGFDEGFFVSLNGFTPTVYSEVGKSSIIVKLVTLPTILAMVEAKNEEVDEVEEKETPAKKENKIVSKSKDTPLHKPSANTSDNLKVVLGQKVDHKAWGAGSIMQVYDGGIAVRFRDEEKKFKFPDAFQQGFLSLYPIKTTTKSKQIEATVINKEDTQILKKCTGNCSTCKREFCIEDS